jgi:hypothetical protein
MVLSTLLNSLDSAQHLYLREISEPRDKSLRLVIQEAVASRHGAVASRPGIPTTEGLWTECAPIESTEDCRTFELRWERYVAYLVTEECVGSCGQYDDEVFTGGPFRVYTKSHFLQHAGSTVCVYVLLSSCSYPRGLRILGTDVGQSRGIIKLEKPSGPNVDPGHIC